LKAVRSLAKETVIYGLTTVFARLLNQVLTPVQTYALNNDLSSYGIITKLMAYVAILNIIYTYGMETAFFRFSTNSKNPKKVGETISTSLLFSTACFTTILFLFAPQLATFINEPGKAIYVQLFAVLVALDTLAVIPFSQLRLDARPKRYMFVKLLNVSVAVCMNLFFFLPGALKQPDLFEPIFTFNSEHAPFYVFASFITASAVQLLVFLPYYVKRRLKWDKSVFNKAWNYSWPLIIFGLAGMINEVLDRIVIEKWLSGTPEYRAEQLGIYGACYRIGMILAMAVRAFRMGADPFFFRSGKEAASRQVFADVLKFFVIFSLTVFLGLTLYIDLISLMVGPNFRAGLYLVPYICMAGVFLGIVFNLNIWYKLTDNTKIGMYVAIAGAVVTVILNYILLPIPEVGILGAAIATLAAYVTMAVISYFLGQKYFPVPYQTGRILSYIAVAVVIYIGITQASNALGFTPGWRRMLFNTPALLLFLGIIYVAEKENLKALFARK